MKSLAAAFALVITPVATAQDAHFRPQERWWECYHFFRLGKGNDKLDGRLVRMVGITGSISSEGWEMWGSGFRIRWQLSEASEGTRPRVSSLSVEVQPIFSRDGQGIVGHVFGDGKLVSSATLLTPKSARDGYAASGALFEGEKLADLGNYDRWSFVARRTDGSEIARQILPVPDRQELDRVFLQHRAAIEAAWQRRDEKFLVSHTSDALPPASATCLFSTPDARAEVQDSAI